MRTTASLVRIPIDAVRVAVLRTVWRSGRRCGDRGIAELQRRIEGQGWIQALTVRPLGPDFYELIDGEPQLNAKRAAAEAEIDAVVLQADDAGAAAIALLTNLRRRGLRPFEKVLLCGQVEAALTEVGGLVVLLPRSAFPFQREPAEPTPSSPPAQPATRLVAALEPLVGCGCRQPATTDKGG
ncbi:MAG: ParB N-terminal domain-containing protein [Gemmatimonadota bacterium]|jgi:hypothetical protein